MANASIFVAPIGSKTDGTFKRARNPILVWAGTGAPMISHIGNTDPATEGFTLLPQAGSVAGVVSGNRWLSTSYVYRLAGTPTTGDWVAEADMTFILKNGTQDYIGFNYSNSVLGRQFNPSISGAGNSVNFGGVNFDIGTSANNDIKLKVVWIDAQSKILFYINNVEVFSTTDLTVFSATTVDNLDIIQGDAVEGSMGDVQVFTAIQAIQAIQL